MFTEGPLLNASYVSSAIRHHLCGLPGDELIAKQCLTGGKTQEFTPIIRHFPDLSAHLDLIAAATNLDPNSFLVAEAYWRGNDLLASFPHPRPTHLSVVFSQNHPADDLFLYSAINQCMVAPGKILEINRSQHNINASVIALSSTGCFYVRRSLSYDPDIFPNLKPGQTITSHLGSVSEEIDRQQFNDLVHWTNVVHREFTQTVSK